MPLSRAKISMNKSVFLFNVKCSLLPQVHSQFSINDSVLPRSLIPKLPIYLRALKTLFSHPKWVLLSSVQKIWFSSVSSQCFLVNLWRDYNYFNSLFVNKRRWTFHHSKQSGSEYSKSRRLFINIQLIKII